MNNSLYSFLIKNDIVSKSYTVLLRKEKCYFQRNVRNKVRNVLDISIYLTISLFFTNFLYKERVLGAGEGEGEIKCL